MEELLLFLTEHGLAAVFLVTLAARIGAPVPASLLLVFAGAMGQAGQLSIWGVAAASVLANLAGDAVWFWGGRAWGVRVLRLVFRFSGRRDACLCQGQSLIERWGGLSLIAAKFVPGVSVVAAPLAGALAMPWPRFIAYGLAAAAAWTVLFLGAGVFLSADVQQLVAALDGAAMLAGFLSAGLIVGLVAYRWPRLRAARPATDCVGHTAALIR
ncbi:hypothetical protein GCM10027034_28430 [Ramlibacter solisilvae]|uniref:DedA family protein n=1 Tax=Ramlibacter tataouinensis TaxID=94132 RepID=UPI0009EEC0DC|nr:DedA family protein [Ramlibacter tataouinensis]